MSTVRSSFTASPLASGATRSVREGGAAALAALDVAVDEGGDCKIPLTEPHLARLAGLEVAAAYRSRASTICSIRQYGPAAEICGAAGLFGVH
jgi:hypothetical protein